MRFSAQFILAGSLLTPSLAQGVTFQNSSNTKLRVDNGTYGPLIEEVQCVQEESSFPSFDTSSLPTIVITIINGRLV